MSDRRRHPNQDEQDDDLGLAGWDRPAAPDRRAQQQPPGERQPRPDRYGNEGDDPRSDAYDPFRPPQPRRATSAQNQYRPATDRYDQDPEQQPGRASQYQDIGQRVRPPSTTRQSSPYDHGEYPDPMQRQSSASASGSGQVYPGGSAEFDAPGYRAPAGKRRKSRPRSASRPRPSVSVPRPAINDGVVIAIVAASLLSLVFMVATIAAGAGDLPAWFPITLNASGDPDSWGASDTLWRIPFGVTMAMAMSLAIAAVLWKRDRFAARFAVSGAAVVQTLAWVALIGFIW